MFGNFTIDETGSIGRKFKVKCKSSSSYERCLTIGKEYEVEIIPAILSLSPLCRGIGDNEKGFQCHLERFEKIE